MRIRTILASAAVVAAPIAATGAGFTAVAQAATGTPVISHGTVETDRSGARMAWECPQTSTFRVTLHGPGKENGRMSVVHDSVAYYTGLKSGHTYEVTIQALVNGKAEGKSGLIVFKTK